jgi:hypothetical protein
VARTCSVRYFLLAVCYGSIALALVARDAPLPTAKEIVERYDQALGGREALLRHSSSTMRGVERPPVRSRSFPPFQ